MNAVLFQTSVYSFKMCSIIFLCKMSYRLDNDCFYVYCRGIQRIFKNTLFKYKFGQQLICCNGFDNT